MRKTQINNVHILQDGGWIYGSLLCEDGIIAEIGGAEPVSGAEVFDGQGLYLVPGFLDLHTHGAVNVDVNAATKEDFHRISRFFATQGVTGWLCSILTDTEGQTLRCIREAKEAMTEQEGARLLGIHLEGPFLSEQYAGAMPKHLLREGDLGLIRRYQAAAEGAIRTITVAPEVPGVLDMILAIAGDVVVSLGHSGAKYDEAMAAIRAGARCITHTGNAMVLFHQHEPGLLGAALESGVYCEAICDGRHLHPGSVRMLLAAKGYDSVIPVTDSIMAAGLPDGEYMLGVNPIVVKDGDAMLRDAPVRAGSTLTGIRAFQNLMTFTGQPMERLLPLMSENPARLLGIDDRFGRIAPGYEGDFVLLDREGTLRYTYVRAQRVH